MTFDDVLATYGDFRAPDFEAKHITVFALPYPLIYNTAMVMHARAHNLAIPKFVAALQAVKDAGLADHAAEYGGIYAVRSIRGFAGHPSAHSWGCAIDVNPQENPLGSTGSMDPAIVAIFKQCGFAWGGEFKSRKDPMHFSLLGF